MVEQGQYVVGNSKAHVVQPQPIGAQTTVIVMIPGLAPRPLMQIFSDNNGGQPQKNKTLKAGIKCCSWHNMGHCDSQCPQRRLVVAPDNIPEATLNATITPAAGSRNNRRYLLQLQKIHKFTHASRNNSETASQLLFPNTSIGGPSQKDSHAAGITCFNYCERGHYARKCPQKKAKTDHRPPPTHRPRQNMPQQPPPRYGPPQLRPFNPSF